MSQFKVGGQYRRNVSIASSRITDAILMDITPGIVYEVTRIYGIYISIENDRGSEESFTHAQFNEFFSAIPEDTPEPVALPPVTPEEFMKVIQRLTEMESRIETLTGELEDAWSEIRDHRRALRRLGD